MLCPDSTPSFWGNFDLSIAPPLLFYSYIPVIVISTLLGIYVLIKDKGSLPSVLLFLIELFFSLWSLNIFMMWIAAYAYDVMFAWQINFVLEIPIFIFSVYFVSVFTANGKKDISDRYKLLFILIALPFAALLTTPFNIPVFDIASCEGVNGPLWDIMYILEMMAVGTIYVIGRRQFERAGSDPAWRKEILYTTIGMMSFLVLFMSSNFLGEISGVQEVSFVGSFGMLLFLGFLTYLIVRYRTFNIKMLATQAFMLALVALTGSQLLYVKTSINKVMTMVSFAISIVFGGLLVRSVQREVAQREEIESLASRLKSVNSILSHDVKGALGKNKDIFSVMLDGTFGPISDKLRTIVQKAFDDTRKLIGSIMTILDSGHDLKPCPQPFDLKGAVLEVVKDVEADAIKKGLVINATIDQTQSFWVVADKTQIVTHVLHNLIENAINYTIQGSIEVDLRRTSSGSTVLSVADTGVGISPDDMAKLFKEGGHGANSIKVNVHSTGYGLFIAKKVVDAHGGKIWVESAGTNKGSTFYVELPADLTCAAPANEAGPVASVALPVAGK